MLQFHLSDKPKEGRKKMKKNLRIVWLCLLVLSMAVGAQAAPVTWDVGPAGCHRYLLDSPRR